MQENSTQWDPLIIDRHPTTLVRVYILLVLITLVVAIVRLIYIWIAAPPFRLAKRAKDPEYLQLLDSLRSSFRQWIGLVVLAGGFVAGSRIVDSSRQVLEMKSIGIFAVVAMVQDGILPLNLTLLAALILFLIQWHLSNRISWLRSKKAMGLSTAC